MCDRAVVLPNPYARVARFAVDEGVRACVCLLVAGRPRVVKYRDDDDDDDLRDHAPCVWFVLLTIH